LAAAVDAAVAAAEAAATTTAISVAAGEKNPGGNDEKGWSDAFGPAFFFPSYC
jgi:hypothetical protein